MLVDTAKLFRRLVLPAAMALPLVVSGCVGGFFGLFATAPSKSAPGSPPAAATAPQGAVAAPTAAASQPGRQTFKGKGSNIIGPLTLTSGVYALAITGDCDTAIEVNGPSRMVGYISCTTGTVEIPSTDSYFLNVAQRKFQGEWELTLIKTGPLPSPTPAMLQGVAVGGGGGVAPTSSPTPSAMPSQTPTPTPTPLSIATP
jgi:hypothetical protein